jgi:hypothetical protein
VLFTAPGVIPHYPTAGNLDAVPDLVNLGVKFVAGVGYDDIEALFYGDTSDRIGVGVNGILAAAPFGRPAKIGGVITGYAIRNGHRHALLQAIGRPGGGVSPRAMLEAVRNPLRIVPQANGRLKYLGQNAVVVVDSEGLVRTTWATNRFGRRWQP